MRQMSYSLCRFWAYDESKKIVGAGAFFFSGGCNGIRLRIRAICYLPLIMTVYLYIHVL